MLYLTQWLYVRPGMEESFHAFEDRVLPLLARHGGELVMRLRPPRDAFIAGSEQPPYELHVVRFNDEAGLAAYANDEERRRWVHLKDASVERSVIVKGST